MSDRNYFIVCALFLISLSSCSTIQRTDTLEEVLAGLACIVYREGMDWKAVSQGLGEPAIHPIPQPGNDLSVNSRGYEGRTLYLMDCGAWVNGGHEIGIISGKDMVVCQWG